MRFLEAHHCRVLLRNYRCRTGELDIVARDTRGELIIAEVRLRARSDYGSAAASVTFAKQRRIVRASRHLLATHPLLARCAIRFDVIEVSEGQEGFAVNWIKHAFTCG